jgi:hypothetical protein
MPHHTAAAALPAPSLADIIPLHELTAALRTAFTTLVTLLNDKKAHPRERRLAATALLRLAPHKGHRVTSDGPPSTPRPRDTGPESAKVPVPPPSVPPVVDRSSQPSATSATLPTSPTPATPAAPAARVTALTVSSSRTAPPPPPLLDPPHFPISPLPEIPLVETSPRPGRVRAHTPFNW